ncbi:MAG TPA: Crp/Fnr family transcriptional regulator [Arenibaculum sp.]|nr:Crp/Fnr family transcriptional regulator [Arenibaculum sp.]
MARRPAIEANLPARSPDRASLRSLAAAAGGTEVRRLAAGEALFHQDDDASAIFEVEEGRLLLVRHTIDTHPVTLHTARPGEFFAEAALFARTYHCDAVAAVASRVRAYPKRRVLAALRDDPDLALDFMAALARQIHVLRSRLEERNIRSARERILHRLALAADNDGRTVQLDGTLIDLAAEIGLSHEVVYRTLAALEREGIIARTRTSITLSRRRGA